MTVAPRRYHKGPLPTHRACRTCGEEKPLTEEHWYRHDKGGFRHVCRACKGAEHFLRTYGINAEEYEALMVAHDRRCAICGDTGEDKLNGMRLCIDHDHADGSIRGLVCGKCNLGLSYFGDDPDRLLSAARYLGAHLHGAS